MRKLTKDQKYYRKKKKDAKRDFRRTNREDGTHGVRVTRKPLCVRISLEAFNKLSSMAEDKGLTRWRMLTRMIIQTLPKYAELNFEERTRKLHRYIWDEIEIADKKRYKRRKKDEKQITYDITSTAYNKLNYHSKSKGLSKARIVESLIVNYTPLTKEQLEREIQRREEYRAKYGLYTSRRFKEDYKKTKFLNCGSGHFIHKKGIPMEYWDDEEFDEWMRLSEEWYNNQLVEEERKKKDMEEWKNKFEEPK